MISIADCITFLELKFNFHLHSQLESSGDDLDRSDDDLLVHQTGDSDVSIDDLIKDQMDAVEEEDVRRAAARQQELEDEREREEEALAAKEREEQRLMEEIAAKELNPQELKEYLESKQAEKEEASTSKKKRRRSKTATAKFISKEIETQIMNASDEKAKRRLLLSKQFNETLAQSMNGQDDSDDSLYYKSSDDGSVDFGVDRVPYHEQKAREGEESGDEADPLYVDGDASQTRWECPWGNDKLSYYGSEVQRRKASNRANIQILRDEEAIAMSMQKEETKGQHIRDFQDKEMDALIKMEKKMRNKEGILDDDERAEWEQQKKEVAERMAKEDTAWGPVDLNASQTVVMDKVAVEPVGAQKKKMYDEPKKEEIDVAADGEANVERIVKRIPKTGKKAHRKVIQRDHPELPGMLRELKSVVAEMEKVYAVRQRAIEKRFDDAIEDATLFVEVLRTYSATICFYLQLKAQRVDMKRMKKQGVYSTLLTLKQRVSSFRETYLKSKAYLDQLPPGWSRKEYLKQKRGLFEYEKQRQRELAEERMIKEAQRERDQKAMDKKTRKMDKRRKLAAHRLMRENFDKLRNIDEKLKGEDQRRGITLKIFKSTGLKRYRQKGIPKVKSRLKYEKKMKLWKKKGFKKFQGKLPNGRMEHYINPKMTHSKRLNPS